MIRWQSTLLWRQPTNVYIRSLSALASLESCLILPPLKREARGVVTRQGDIARRAVEEANAKTVLKTGDGIADCCRRHLKLERRRTEATEPGFMTLRPQTQCLAPLWNLATTNWTRAFTMATEPANECWGVFAPASGSASPRGFPPETLAATNLRT
jgi:hypothetical protein